MNRKEINQLAAVTEEQYVAPQIEMIEIETSQNILALGGSNGETSDFEGEDWGNW